MKSVRFNLEVTVLETYSSDEYDRSDIFSTPVFYKLNPKIKPPPLSININNNLPSLINDEDEDIISSAEINSPDTPPISHLSDKKPFEISIADQYLMEHQQLNKKKKIKPFLTVNTTICSDPLFFTNLSTNYKTKDQEKENDFLIPLSAYPTTQL